MPPFVRPLISGLAVAPGVGLCLLATGAAPTEAVTAAAALAGGWATGIAALEVASTGLLAWMARDRRPPRLTSR